MARPEPVGPLVSETVAPGDTQSAAPSAALDIPRLDRRALAALLARVHEAAALVLAAAGLLSAAGQLRSAGDWGRWAPPSWWPVR